MDPSLLLLFIILFFLSAFFSWTEIALMSLSEHKIDSLLKQGKIWAKSLKKIKSNNDRLLIAILIWNNLANVYTAALATSLAISIANTAGIGSGYVIGLATGIVTFLLLIFWEIVPKSFATRNASFIAVKVAPIYDFLILIFYPIIILLELIIKLFAWKQAHVEKVTDEEIESFIDMWMTDGTIEKWAYEKIKNILDFWDTTAEEIMIPRVKIDSLPLTASVEEAFEYYVSHTHSRIPVYDETIDKIDYFLTIRDILNVDQNKKLSELPLKKVLKVPLNKPLSKLLETFQKSNRHMAILIDEYGGVEWLITLEDVLEEVFWEIRDETDKEIDEIYKISENTFSCESGVAIENVLEKFDLDFESIGLDEKEFGWETLSYLVTHKLGRFPSNGEVIHFDFIYHKEEEKEWQFVLKITEVKESKIGNIEATIKK